VLKYRLPQKNNVEKLWTDRQTDRQRAVSLTGRVDVERSHLVELQ